MYSACTKSAIKSKFCYAGLFLLCPHSLAMFLGVFSNCYFNFYSVIIAHLIPLVPHLISTAVDGVRYFNSHCLRVGTLSLRALDIVVAELCPSLRHRLTVKRCRQNINNILVQKLLHKKQIIKPLIIRANTNKLNLSYFSLFKFAALCILMLNCIRFSIFTYSCACNFKLQCFSTGIRN